MTDSDLSALNEAIYGGERLSETRLQAILVRYGWTESGSLHAGLPDTTRQAAVLKIAADLHLFQVSGGELYQDYGEFYGAAQRSIVAFRLSHLRQRGWTPFKGDAWAHEQGLRALALSTYRRQEAHWQDAVSLWFIACSGRHHIKLDRLRRKLIEFIMLLCADIDNDPSIDGGIRHALTDINSTHVLEKLEQLFMNTLRWLQPSISLINLATETAAPAFVVSAMRLLQKRFDQPLSIPALAAELSVSREHLMRQFKKVYAVTIQYYITQLRVDHAQELLRQTNDSLMSIAIDCGFASQEQLHRAFRKIAKTTPQRYRKQLYG